MFICIWDAITKCAKGRCQNNPIAFSQLDQTGWTPTPLPPFGFEFFFGCHIFSNGKKENKFIIKAKAFLCASYDPSLRETHIKRLWWLQTISSKKALVCNLEWSLPSLQLNHNFNFQTSAKKNFQFLEYCSNFYLTRGHCLNLVNMVLFRQSREMYLNKSLLCPTIFSNDKSISQLFPDLFQAHLYFAEQIHPIYPE